MIPVRLPTATDPLTVMWANQMVRGIESTFYQIGNDLANLLSSSTYNSSWMVNVKEHGAVGDLVTNDTAAVQAAINAAGTKAVWFPPGTYLVNSLTLTEGCTIMGSGPNTTMLLAAANNIPIFYYQAQTSIKVGFSISNLSLSNYGKTGCHGILLDGNTTGIRISQVRLENLDIEGAFAFGIKLRLCANTFISNCFLPGNIDGVVIDNCADTDIVSVKVQSGTGYGFYINGGLGAFDEGVRLVACSTNGQHYGLGINGQDWGVATSCSFTTSPGGSLIAGTATNWKFSACEFAVGTGAPAAAGVSLASTCTGFSFNACQFSNNTFGAVLRGNNHSVSGSIFLGNSNIDLTLDGALHCTVTGNNLDSAAAAASVIEIAPANFNALTGNTGNLPFTTVGANSLSTGNITY